MRWAEALYTFGWRAALLSAPLLSRGEGKIARGLRGREGSAARLRRWGETARDPGRPVVWFHAPSVGEGLQALAVIQALRSARPDVQVVYTFFSPSAERFARSVSAEMTDYLPPDLPDAASEALQGVQPDALLYSKSDVWPNLTREAARRGVPTALLSATLPASSSRLAWPARALLRPAYGRLALVGAISAADADRFSRLGVAEARRRVMGDARFDQVWERASESGRDSALLAPLRSSRFTLVAGSTWAADEERLIPAWAAAIGRGGRLILAPHEPTEAYLAEAEALVVKHSLSLERLSGLSQEAASADVLLVDRVGVLGDLYALADLAYVGGGFGTAGLHSVLEPAAFGVPVLFGPRHANAREASELISRGGAYSVENSEAVRSRLADLHRDDAARSAAGAAARQYVADGLGAAGRGAEIVLELIDRARNDRGSSTDSRSR